MNDSFLQNLNWRFATKQFDPKKKVSKQDLEKILQAIRMSPSSRGWQPFQVVVVEDDALKQKLYPVSNNQSQVVDCSHLLVFCLRTDLRKRADDYLQLAVRDKSEEEKQKLRENFYAFADRKKDQGIEAWAGRQAYIALGFGLAACAELKIDSCPMEGFQPAEVDRILGLAKDIKSQGYLAIGYRWQGPKRDKFRFAAADLFVRR